MPTYTIGATGQTSLGSIPTTRTGFFTVQVAGSTSPAWSGSIIPKARLAAPLSGSNPDTPLSSLPLIPIPYSSYSGGSTQLTSTPITTDGIYAIFANGVEIVLDATVTAGSATINTNPIVTSVATFPGTQPVTGTLTIGNPDPWSVNASRAGNAYVGTTGVNTIAAGALNFCIILNNPSTTKRLLVRNLVVGSSATAPTTITVVRNPTITPMMTGYVFNTLLGGATSVATVKFQALSSGTIGGTTLATIGTYGGRMAVDELREQPLIVPPSNSVGLTAAYTVGVSAEFLVYYTEETV